MVKPYLGGLGVDRRIILIWIFINRMGELERTDLGQVSGNLLALVEAVVQIQFPQQEEYFITG